jgi:hypothetical protein
MRLRFSQETPESERATRRTIEAFASARCFRASTPRLLASDSTTPPAEFEVYSIRLTVRA